MIGSQLFSKMKNIYFFFHPQESVFVLKMSVVGIQCKGKMLSRKNRPKICRLFLFFFLNPFFFCVLKDGNPILSIFTHIAITCRPGGSFIRTVGICTHSIFADKFTSITVGVDYALQIHSVPILASSCCKIWPELKCELSTF